MTKIEEELRYIKARRDLEADPDASISYKISELILSKTTALLTHVSIMIAISTALFNYYKEKSSELWFIRYLFMIEIVGYIFITLLCLRALFQTEWNCAFNNFGTLKSYHLINQRRRRLYYMIALRLTFLFTFLLGLTLFVSLYMESGLPSDDLRSIDKQTKLIYLALIQ